jgi:hypothetical protein
VVSDLAAVSELDVATARFEDGDARSNRRKIRRDGGDRSRDEPRADDGQTVQLAQTFGRDVHEGLASFI